MWNIESYHILTKGSLWWNTSNYHSTVVSKKYWSSIWYAIALKTESRHDANIVITQEVIMMTICRDHIDDKVGITAIFDCRYYSWSSEHQDYECNTLALTTISWKWISFVLPCFKHAGSCDRQCITLTESLWTMNTFLVTNESQVCELCVSMFRNNDIGLSRSI